MPTPHAESSSTTDLPESLVNALIESHRPIFRSRKELNANLDPVTGHDAEIMAEATRRAEDHAEMLGEPLTRAGRPGAAQRRIGAAGVKAVTKAIDAYRDDEDIPAGYEAAWLTVVLRNLWVRDDAWCRMDRRWQKHHLRLWADLTRLAQPGYAAAPASLLAFVACQSGDIALATIALNRAMDDRPGYRMAQLVRHAVDSGISRALTVRVPMTPEEAAASYRALWGDDD